MSNTKISVVVPCYNVEVYFEKFILSVISQTFSDFEIILIDDGSTDNSLAIMKKYEKKDKRIKCYHQENQGVGAARNLGIVKSKGRYLIFCDPDDYLDLDMLESINQDLENNDDVELLIYGHKEVDIDYKLVNIKVGKNTVALNDNKSFGEKFLSIFEQYNMFSLWNKVYLRSKLIEKNILFSNHRTGQDAIFNLNLYRYVNSIVITPKCYYNYLVSREASAQTRYNRWKVKDNMTIGLFLIILRDEWGYSQKSFIDEFILSSVSLQIREVKRRFPNPIQFHKECNYIFSDDEVKNVLAKGVRNSYFSIKNIVKKGLLKFHLYYGFVLLNRRE